MSDAVLPSDERARVLVDRWREGWTVERIADAIGVARSYCVKLARGLGLRRPVGWKPPGWDNNRGHGPRRGAGAVVSRAERSPADAAVAVAAPSARAPGEAEAIAAFLAARGVTRCPPAAVARTSTTRLAAEAEIRLHRERLDGAAARGSAEAKAAARAAVLARGGAG